MYNILGVKPVRVPISKLKDVPEVEILPRPIEFDYFKTNQMREIITEVKKQSLEYIETHLRTVAEREVRREDMDKFKLLTGMVAETREGNRYIVLRNYTYKELGTSGKESTHDVLQQLNSKRWERLDSYNVDLTSKLSKGLDIVKVYVNVGIQLIPSEKTLLLAWERKEPLELKESEVEKLKAIKALYPKHNYLVQCDDNYSFISMGKPYRTHGECGVEHWEGIIDYTRLESIVIAGAKADTVIDISDYVQ